LSLGIFVSSEVLFPVSTAVILFLACAQPAKPSHDNHGNVQQLCSLYGQQIIPCAVNCNIANTDGPGSQLWVLAEYWL